MKKVKNLDLIIILASITVLALITAVVLLTRPYEARTLEDIKTVEGMDEVRLEYGLLQEWYRI